MYVLCLLPASVGTYRTLPWRMFRGFQFLGINYTKLEYFWEGGRRWRMRMIICVHVRVRVHVCVHVFTYRYLSSTWLSATRENWVMHRRRDEWKHANKYICVCVCVCAVCYVLCAMCCVLCVVPAESMRSMEKRCPSPLAFDHLLISLLFVTRALIVHLQWSRRVRGSRRP